MLFVIIVFYMFTKGAYFNHGTDDAWFFKMNLVLACSSLHEIFNAHCANNLYYDKKLQVVNLSALDHVLDHGV